MSTSKLTGNKSMTFLRYLIVFIVPVIFTALVYKKLEISPFGNNSILCMDLWGEYLPMYKHNMLDASSLSDLLYSWKGGLGHNNVVESAYYCNSIFFLVFKFCSLDTFITALDILCMLKFGFSAITCLFFLENKLESKSPFLLLGAISYSLCGYALAYLAQCMWTDCIIYLPLILFGLDRLVDKKKPLVYIISLAAVMISSFFIGYSICLFLVIYFLFDMFCKFKLVRTDGHLKLDAWKEHLFNGIRFGVSSILAAGLATIVLIPVAAALSQALVSDSEFPSTIEWYNNLAEYLNAMLPSTPPSLAYGIPNISTGIFMFLLVPLYFLNKKISFREKIFSGIMLAILYIAMNTTTFNYVWHGFVFPNQLPGRWTFIVSLALVLLAMKGLTKREGADNGAVAGSLIIGLFLLMVTQLVEPKYEKSQMSAYAVAIAVFAAGLILINIMRAISKKFSQKRIKLSQEVLDKTKALEEIEETETESESVIEEDAESEDIEAEVVEDVSEREAMQEELEALEKSLSKASKNSKLFRGIAFGCAVLLVAYSGYRVCDDYRNVGSEYVMKSNLESYNACMEVLDTYGSLMDSGDDDFYRIIANSGYTFNSGMIGNYKGMSYYSSTMQGTTFLMLRYLGNRVYADMRSSVYNHNSPVQNSIFGIKYYLDRDKSLQYSLPYTELVEEYEKCNIRENTTALPIAFTASPYALDTMVTDEIRGITNQNNLLNSLMGENIDVFEKMELSEPIIAENAELDYSDSWNTNYFYTNYGESQAKIIYNYTCNKTGELFAEQNFRAGSLTVYSADREVSFDIGAEKFKYLGTYNEGDQIRVEAVIDNVGIGCYGFELYNFNQEKWQSCYEKLNSGGLDVNSFKSTKITGNLTSQGSNFVFTSIPQDGGWKVYCDGKETEISLVGDLLIGFYVQDGEHEITFKYSLPGLKAGVAITIVCLITTAFYVSPKLRAAALKPLKAKKKKKENK